MTNEVRAVDEVLLGHAFVAGARVAGVTALAASLTVAIVFAVNDPALDIRLDAGLLVATLALLAVLVRTRSRLVGVAYLAVGSVAVWAYASTFLPYVSQNGLFDVIAVSLPHAALVLIGSPRRRLLESALWNTAGYVVGTSATFVAAVSTDARFTLWTFAAFAYALSLLMIGLTWFAIRRHAHAAPPVRQAAHADVAAVARARIEARAAALLHDTVLSHLAAISHAPDGPIDPNLARQIEYDRAAIMGDGWLAESTTASTLVAEWEKSALFEVVAGVEESGLTVDFSGDPLAALRLAPARLAELSLAVKQCLVNVLVHSGEARAELAVHVAGESVVVMVIDTGRGFDESAVSVDRFGVSGSIRGRVDRLGGSTQIWSTPGEGTSIILDIPMTPTEILGAARMSALEDQS